MRPGPVAQGGREATAPALLLDVQTAAGEMFYWSDPLLIGIEPVLLPLPPSAPPPLGILTPDIVIVPPIAIALPTYLPWLLGSGSFNFNRSTNTDTGSLTVQNLSGDVLASEWERIVRRSTLEGALYVFRYYQVDIAHAWIEQHGTLTVGDASRTSVDVKLSQLLQGQDDTPVQDVSETCQLVWGEKRCGATGPTECLYTYASCQKPVHFCGIQTAFETNNPSSIAQLPVQTVNRKRNW